MGNTGIFAGIWYVLGTSGNRDFAGPQPTRSMSDLGIYQQQYANPHPAVSKPRPNQEIVVIIRYRQRICWQRKASMVKKPMTKIVLLARLILFVALSMQTIAAIDVPPPPPVFTWQ